MLTFRAIGDWSEADVSVTWTHDTRLRSPQIDAQIDRAWAAASARLEARLFDGPMCRLEMLDANPALLRLSISPTSYKPFLGTNLMNAEVTPPGALANPLGLSVTLLTSDGWLMLGQRNGSVAYHPNRVHPFAGSLEPGDAPNVFDGARRELAEELQLTPGDIAEMRCLGIIEDARLKQPEIIFSVQSKRSRVETESMLDGREHRLCVAIEPSPQHVSHAMGDALLTPVAVGALALWGRAAFGSEWFDVVRSAFVTHP